MSTIKDLIESKKNGEEITRKLTESLPDNEYQSIERDLKDVLGVLRGAVGQAGVEQVFSAGEGLNDAVGRLMKDLADQRSFSKNQVDKAFKKSDLSPKEFVKQVKQFADKAV